MEKFGLFDVIEKLLPLFNNNNANSANRSNVTKPHVNTTVEQKRYDDFAIKNYIKRHEEISKRIDENYKKKE